ncbi:hypothetical protein, partial [Vogesella indigofera]
VRKIELSRENFCSGEPKLINFSTCRSSLEGCGRINQHFLNKAELGSHRLLPSSIKIASWQLKGRIIDHAIN